MKKCITWNCAQTWVTKIDNHHGRRLPDLFAGNHQLTTQKPVSECYIIDQFIGMILKWSEDCAIFDAVGLRGLRVIRNSTENLH